MDIIEDQYTQAKALLKYLTDKEEISLLSYAELNLTKNFLLQCTSFHEDELMGILKSFADKSTDKRLSEFVKHSLLDMRYFRIFFTENNNINKFISFFGEDFKETFTKDINGNEALDKGVKSFIGLAKLRELIHKNLATFSLDKTIDEVYQMHNETMRFVQYLKETLLS